VIEAAAKRFALGLIFEPARETGDLVQSRKGIGTFTVICHGRAAHAARAGDGRNAIVALAEFLIAADQIPKDFPGVLLNIGSIQGGGAVNIVPDLARAELNLRITRAADATSVVERLRSLAAPINAREGFRLEIAGEFNRLPMEATPASTACFEAWQRCAKEVGAAPFSWVHVGGGSDGNLLAAAGLPCLDGLGPVGGHLHSADEYILLPSLAERAQIAARFLEKLAAGEIALPARI
jgi:glutamate carboxypeptidase